MACSAGAHEPHSPHKGQIREVNLLEVFYMSAPLAVERVTIGPQGTFAKVPGLDVGYRLLTKVFPLGRGKIVEREGKVFVSTPPGGRQSRRGIAYPPCVQALMALSNPL